MTDFRDLLGGGDSASPAAPAAPTDYRDLLGGTAPPAPEAPQQSPLVGHKAGPANFLDIAIASLAAEPEARADYYAKQAGNPRSRYEIRDGQVFFNDGRGLQPVETGSYGAAFARGMGDTLPAAGSLLGGAAGAALGGAAGSALPGPGTAGGALTGALQGGVLGAGAGGQLREIASSLMVGNPYDFAASTRRVAREMAFDMGGAIAGKLVSRGVNSRVVKKAVSNFIKYSKDNPLMDALLQSQREIEELTGIRIDLTMGELTGQAQMLEEERMLKGLPGASGFMQEAGERQAGQVAEAIPAAMGKVLPGADVGAEVAGGMARGASVGIYDDLVKQRRAHAERLYTKAFREAKGVDLEPFLDQLDKQYQMSGRTVRRALDRVKGFVKDLADDPEDLVNPQRLEDVHNKVRTEMQILEQTVPPRAGAKITKLMRRYLDPALDAASPGYADARALYSDMSGSMERALEGQLGGLAKTGDAALQEIPARLFTKAGPKLIGQTRTRFLQTEGGKEVWDANVRAYMLDEWGKTGKEFFSGIANPSRARASQGARFFAKVWGDPSQLARWRAILEPKQYKALDSLMKVLRATGQTLDFNSATAMRQEMLAEMKTAARPGVARAAGFGIKNINPLQLTETLGGFLAEGATRKNLERIARVVTDPSAIQQILSSGKAPKMAGGKLSKLLEDNPLLVMTVARLLSRGPVQAGVEGQLGPGAP